MKSICKNTFNCPVEATIQLIGGKYKAVILWHLMNQTLRILAFSLYFLAFFYALSYEKSMVFPVVFVVSKELVTKRLPNGFAITTSVLYH